MTTLTDHEKTLIIQALYAIAPSGGGSAPFHLAAKLCGTWGVFPSDQTILDIQERVHREYQESISE